MQTLIRFQFRVVNPRFGVVGKVFSLVQTDADVCEFIVQFADEIQILGAGLA